MPSPIMPRLLSGLSIELLTSLSQDSAAMFHAIMERHVKAKNPRPFDNAMYRLQRSGYIEKGKEGYRLTDKGYEVIHNYEPKKDGIWKLIIFDIPEKQRPVRNFLRQKLQSLGFQKWQNSIWVSPYELDPELEKELLQLAQKYFVRLIKTTDINYDKDLQKLFPN